MNKLEQIKAMLKESEEYVEAATLALRTAREQREFASSMLDKSKALREKVEALLKEM